MKCTHNKVKCLECGEEGTPASLLGKDKKKTLSEKALEARRQNAKKGGRPRKENPFHLRLVLVARQVERDAFIGYHLQDDDIPSGACLGGDVHLLRAGDEGISPQTQQDPQDCE